MRNKRYWAGLAAGLTTLGLLVGNALMVEGEEDSPAMPSPAVLPSTSLAPSENPNSSGSAEPAPIAGKPMAVVEIPKLGLKTLVNEGITTNDLKQAAGHYRDTALPGQQGNFAIAGHRCCSSNGQVFKYLDKVTVGDEIKVETATANYVYRIVEQPTCGSTPLIVHESKVDVISPTPCGGSESGSYMTITTCTYHETDPAVRTGKAPAKLRLVLFAKLESTTSRS